MSSTKDDAPTTLNKNSEKDASQKTPLIDNSDKDTKADKSKKPSGENELLSPPSISYTKEPTNVDHINMAVLSPTTEEIGLEQLMDQMETDLMMEEQRIAEAQKKAEVQLRIRWWSLLFINFASIAAFIVVYFGRYTYDMDKLADLDIENYRYGGSFIDMTCIYFIRFIVVFLVLGTIESVTERNNVIFELGYWISCTCFILSITKAIVVDEYDDSKTVIALCVLGIVFETMIFGLLMSIAPETNTAEFDPYAQEEAAAREARLKAHKEATERAAALEKTLTGEELAKHRQKEAYRVRSYEYVEKKALADTMHRQNSKFKVHEFLLLLRPYFAPPGFYKKTIVFLTWVVVAGSKAALILSPIYIGKATDQLINEGTVPWGYISAFAGLGLLGQALKQLQGVIYLQVKLNAFTELANLVFTHVMGLDVQWHLTKKMGSILRVTDRGLLAADTIVNYLLLLLVPSLVEALIIFILFYTRFEQPVLSGIVFFFLMAYMLTTIQLTIMRKKYRRALVHHENVRSAIYADSLTNIMTIKLNTAEHHLAKQYTHSVQQYQKANIGTQVTLSVLNTLQQLIIQAAVLLTLFCTAHNIAQGKSSVGTLAAVSAYTVQVFSGLSFLGTIFDMVVSSLIDLSSLADLLNEKPTVTDGEGALLITDGASIEFDNVVFNYDQQPVNQGLQGISFTVNPGETVALVGGTGAGKSTISKLLYRAYDVKGGAIRVCGQDIRDVTLQSLRSCIAVVPQETMLFNDTLLYNLKFGRPDATYEEVIAACKAAQILDFIESLPQRFETKVGTRGMLLSGGQMQRVAICRAILRNPDILILDESTSALDTHTERLISGALRNLEKGRTSIVIAHRLSTIVHANQILVLDKGKIVEKGTHKELLGIENGIYAKLWRTQAETPSEVVLEEQEEQE